MTGMISYSDAPQLHDMVDNRNYRMICIFEVLTQNRLESDFLENLGLLSQVAREQEQVSNEMGSDNREEEDIPEQTP